MKSTAVTFLWHMHQPDYRLPGENRSLLPWVRLHATKAYFDMPWMLARHPGVKACINLSGSLLSQLKAMVHDGARDVWWDLTVKPAEALEPDERRFMLENFFSVHWDRQVRPMSGYWRLLQKRGLEPGAFDPGRFSDQELRDLQVFFNLAWMGFAARAEYPWLVELAARDGNFTEADKARLLEIQVEIMGRVLPMTRALAEAGQVELTTTPMFHPILPLLVDSDAARRPSPERPVPRRFAWPQDAAWHVEAACQLFESLFGKRPAGMWPAEGSVSPEAVAIFGRCGLRWIASDEDVLMASHPRPNQREDALYRPHLVDTPTGPVAMLFRDHILSDLIGFTYATSGADEAAGDLVGRLLEGGARATATGQPLIPIILDGENPWESYEDDGRPFLEALYRRLADTPGLETVTVTEALDRGLGGYGRLHHLHSGSWIRANYQIWIGAPETNAAWNLLGEARTFLERTKRELALHEKDPRLEAAMEAIHAAEGSDWFWWYGDDFTSTQDEAFDALFRGHLRAVYRALGHEPPGHFHRPITTTTTPVVLTQPRILIKPVIDGVVANYFDWMGAGRYEPQSGAGSMYRARRYVKLIHFGYDLECFYLRLDHDTDLLSERIEELTVRVVFGRAGVDQAHQAVTVALGNPTRWILEDLSGERPPRVMERPGMVAFERLLELAVPFEWMEAAAPDACHFSVALLRGDIELERHPSHGQIDFIVPDARFEQENWLV